MSLRDIHTPVLLDRCVELLAPALERDGAVFVDATLGMGGHSEAFLERFPGIHLVGLDRDQDALRIAGERLAPFGDRITLVHTVYDGIAAAVESAGFDAADGILFDLGVSSLQLDVADRGFAYSQDAPLDMRMDQTTGPDGRRTSSRPTARASCAASSSATARRSSSGRYARAIIKARESEPIERSGQLVEILVAATPYAAQRTGHPAKRVFQALRIEVNGELAVLERAIPAALGILPGRRPHRRARRTSRSRTASSSARWPRPSASTSPAGLPVELPEHAPRFRLLVKGAELASEEERARNPRATPVRLRAAERVRDAA